MTEFDRLAEAVDVSTTAVVCSHVSWVTGALAPAELASVGAPVIYDGAQGVGAVPVDVKVLGLRRVCRVRAEVAVRPRRERNALRRARVPRARAHARRGLLDSRPSRMPASTPSDGRTGARGTTPVLSGETSRYALASLELLAEAGWDEVHTRGVELAAPPRVDACGRRPRVRPRGDTTLVSGSTTTPSATTSARAKPAS